MSYYVVDVESDGPILGRNSLVCFGSVRLDNELQTTMVTMPRGLTGISILTAVQTLSATVRTESATCGAVSKTTPAYNGNGCAARHLPIKTIVIMKVFRILTIRLKMRWAMHMPCSI